MQKEGSDVLRNRSKQARDPLLCSPVAALLSRLLPGKRRQKERDGRRPRAPLLCLRTGLCINTRRALLWHQLPGDQPSGLCPAPSKQSAPLLLPYIHDAPPRSQWPPRRTLGTQPHLHAVPSAHPLTTALKCHCLRPWGPELTGRPPAPGRGLL